MARYKDANWTLSDPAKIWAEVHAALLMDIRDELKQLNKTLGCYRVQRMSDDIHRMEKRLASRLPLSKGRKRGA